MFQNELHESSSLHVRHLIARTALNLWPYDVYNSHSMLCQVHGVEQYFQVDSLVVTMV